MPWLPSAISAPSSPTACLRLTHLTSTPYTSVPSPTHPYCSSCFVLVRSVVAWEPGGFILSHREPMGTEVHSSISLLLPI
jgi:hypothetical protein